jgi:hypothetical protein
MTPPIPGQLPLVQRTREELLAELTQLRERSLSDVQRHAQLAAEAERQLADAVAAARGAGASWADVAAATGITRQGAQQRWGR